MKICAILAMVLSIVQAQGNAARWCTVGPLEQRKCEDMKAAFKSQGWKPDVDCVTVEMGNECLRKIERSEADLVRLTDPTAYTAGRFHNLIPIMHQNSGDKNYLYQTVAVIKANNTDIKSLADLKGKRSCHTGVGRTAGWQSPIANLNAKKLLPIVDCENNVKNTAAFFSLSCVPGAFSAEYDPDFNNPEGICSICKDPKCPRNETYAGYIGAFRCLVDGKGDVAFVKHSTVPIDARGKYAYDTIDYRLLCLDGQRRTVDNYDGCSWGVRPSHAIFTRPNADTEAYKRLFERGSTYFGRNSNHSFQMFSSDKYGGKDLLFTDGTFDLVNTGHKNTYIKYLGQGFVNFYEYIRPKSCKKSERLCVISSDEMNKCVDMRDAMATGKVTVDFSCVLGKDRDDCMKKIKDDEADFMTADAWETYNAITYYGLALFLTEQYAGVDSGVSRYAVAVTKKSNPVTLKTLKGKKSCHTGVWDSAGWNLPMGTLVNDNQIKVSGCNAESAVADYFGESCAPGVVNEEGPAKLCSLCNDDCGISGKYAGASGAFRCLLDKNADVTFVHHDTVKANTDGRNTEDWAKNLNSDDFVLLCSDGTRKPVSEWESCHLGKVPSRAMLTRSTTNDDHRRHYKFLFYRMQSRYGSGSSDKSFRMFKSFKDTQNLIFRDDTSNLAEVKYVDNTLWLGADFMKKTRAVDPRYCTTSAGSTTSLISFATFAMHAMTITLIVQWCTN